MSTKEATARIYFCGGAALNIGTSLFHTSQNRGLEEGFANIESAYIDTSRSNALRVNKDEFYLVEGMSDADEIDGSGKVRATNYKAIKMAAPDILHKHKPGDINIVIHSASGGSGGVLAPVLVSELLSQDRDVIVIMIGSSACIKELSNTVDTIHSYEGISQKAKKSVVAIYLENSKNVTMTENDSRARINALILAAVWSRQNHGLDGRDLDHFLNYDKVTEFPPALVGLELYSAGSTPSLRKGQAVSSMVTLVREGEDPTPDMMVGYHSYGIISAAASANIKVPSPFHLMTIQGYYAGIVADLQARLSEAREQYRVQHVQTLKLDGLNKQDDGLVL